MKYYVSFSFYTLKAPVFWKGREIYLSIIVINRYFRATKNFQEILQVSFETSSVSIQGFKASSSKYTDQEINFYFCLCRFKEYFLLYCERGDLSLTADSTVRNLSATCLCGLEVEVSFSKQKIGVFKKIQSNWTTALVKLFSPSLFKQKADIEEVWEKET